MTQIPLNETARPEDLFATSDDGRDAPQRAARRSDSVSHLALKMQDRYDAMVLEMKRHYQVRINKWRTGMTGCAWIVYYHDGSTSRLIESPRPKGPMSAAIFLHEIGHHAIGFNRYSPRCYEEYMAWEWSLQAMRQFNFTITDRVSRRVNDSLRYAVAKALRRGLRQVPAVLLPFAEKQRMVGQQAV